MCENESERKSQEKLNVMKHTSGNVIHFVFISLKKGAKNALNVPCGLCKNVWTSVHKCYVLYAICAVQMRVNESKFFK